MRMQGLRNIVVLAAMLAIAGCGKKADLDSPLAFVPDDTPYLFANIEPLPDASIARWQAQMQAAWPLMNDIFNHALSEIDKKDGAAPVARVMRAVLDEMRTRNTPAQWEQIGFSPKAHVALYGVDLQPVLRIELADADAFRAALARIEHNAGSTFATSRIGDQEIRSFGNAHVQGLLAIEGHQLVLGFVPGAADEALKRRVLGLDKPAQSIAASGALATFNKTRGYLPYGSGWVDTRRIVVLAAANPAMAKAAADAGAQPVALDATCRDELDAIAAKAPRFAFGYTDFDGQHLTAHARLDLAPALAQSLIAVGGSTPGIASNDALFDMAFALPILRARDFWVAQAEAVAKAPFRCALLAPMNAQFAQAKAKLDQTIPPPLADLGGVRMSFSHFAWPAGSDKPDLAGSVLIGSNNPGFLANLAQVSVPALRDIKLAANAKPVPIPAMALPGALAGNLDINVAMSAKTLGLAIGKDEATKLGAAVAATPATPGELFDMHMRGEFYAAIADAMTRFADKMPAEQRTQLETQRKLYALYAQWFRHIEARVTIVPEGIDFIEAVQFGNP